VREPSLLVSELLETVERMHGEAAAKRLRVEHPLQPFSPRAFGAADGEDDDSHDVQSPRIDPRRFSYRREWQLAPGTGLGLRPPPPFVPPGFALPPPADADETTTADTGEGPIRSPDRDQLRRFFDNPARAWLQDRLGLHLPELPEEAEDREPQGEHRLRRYQLIAALLPGVPTVETETVAAPASSRDADGSPLEVVRSLRARALLPPGRDGEVALEDAQPVADSLKSARQAQTAPADTLDTVRDALQQAMADDTPRLIVEAQFPVAFRFDDVLRLRDGSLLRVVVEAGKLHGQRLLRAGIDHLLLAAVHGEIASTCLICEGEREARSKAAGAKAAASTVGVEICRFGGLSQAHALAHLHALLALWHEGRRAPLPFAPKSAYEYAQAYAEAVSKSKFPAQVEAAAWSKATTKFNPSSDPSQAGRSESEDPYIALAYRPESMLDPPDSAQALRFRSLALQVFEGLGRQPPETARDKHATPADKREAEGATGAGAATKKAARATKAGTSADAAKSTARTRKPRDATEPPP
jgi:exodeoxyribonuclease V gamma subunit